MAYFVYIHTCPNEKHMSNETRLKISEAKKGIKMSDEFKKRRSDYMKEYWKKKKESI